MEQLTNHTYSRHEHLSERATSNAFPIEYCRDLSYKALFSRVVTYLGEYRLEVKKQPYTLLFSREQDGLHIRDIDEGDAMIEIAKRAIIPGQPKYYRRIAEYAALEKEEELVAMAEDGDIIIQASPPQNNISDEESYGFFFVGSVEIIHAEKKLIHKNALRITNPTLNQLNTALSRITGQNISFTTQEQFIATPFFLGKNTTEDTIQDILSEECGFNGSYADNALFICIIKDMAPHIQHFISMVLDRKPDTEVYAMLGRLENCAIFLKEMYTTKPHTANISDFGTEHNNTIADSPELRTNLEFSVQQRHIKAPLKAL